MNSSRCASRAVAVLVAAVLLTACAHTPATPVPPATAVVAPTTSLQEGPVPHAQRFAVDRARTFGTLTHRHTRALQRALALTGTRPNDALGSISEQIDGVGSVRVSFVRGAPHNGQSWRIWQRVVVSTDESTTPPEPVVLDEVPTTFERNKLRALLTTAPLATTQCAGDDAAPISVALSWRQGGRDVFYVYRSTPLRRVGGVLQGAQTEWLLDATGNEVLASRQFAADCQVAQLTAASDVAPLLMEARSSEAPSAFAVYVALATATQVEVRTDSPPTRWRITGERVQTLHSAATANAAQTTGATSSP